MLDESYTKVHVNQHSNCYIAQLHRLSKLYNFIDANIQMNKHKHSTCQF